MATAMYKSNVILLVLFTLLAGQTLLANEFRTFKSNDGVEIRARLIKFSESKGVSIILDNGRPFDVPLERFSKEDQEYIREWHKTTANLLTPDSDFEVYVGAQKSKKGEGSSVGGQMQYEIIQPVVRITNKEWTEDFKGVEGVVAVIARNVRSNNMFMVVTVEEFNFEHIAHGSTAEWQGKKGETSWYDDDGDGSDDSSGYRYKGTVIALKNRNGDLVYTKGTRSSWEGGYDKIKGLRAGNVYDDDLRNSINTSYY